MGVESGGGTGDASPVVEKSAGDVPPEMMIFTIFFLTYLDEVYKILHFPTF